MKVDLTRGLYGRSKDLAEASDEPTAYWLRGSVLRPLATLLDATPVHSRAAAAVTSDPDRDEATALALDATRLRAGPDAEPELVEATAALHAIALAKAPDEDADRQLRAELAELAELPTGIDVVDGGPYLACNAPRIEDWLGRAIPLAPQVALCRCGCSARKPLCDGSHADGFDDAKSPDRVPDRPAHVPMPNWGWTTAAGPPGSRVSAIDTASEPEHRVTLPDETKPISFHQHVRQLFRDRDRDSLRFAFDLWSHDDVRQYADEILARVRNGTMPCDGRWPAEWVDLLARWIETGCRP